MTAQHIKSDLRGASRLAIAATVGVTDLVEAMHRTIASVPAPIGKSGDGHARGIAGLVYGAVRGTTRAVGGGIDAALALLPPLLGEAGNWPRRTQVLAALNGILGDYLAATGNPLATTMQLRRDGEALELERTALSAAFPKASGKLLVLVHGLCMSDLQWNRAGHDHGAVLARSLGCTPVYLNYNSGLHVSTNGRQFAGLLEQLVREWPVPVSEIAIVGHSMGGLVTRSAAHVGQQDGQAWTRRLRNIVFLGTPHHGAPLERGGHWVDAVLGVSPYTAAFNRLGRVRSAGITDLRHGSLLDSDWQGHDRFAHGHDTRTPVPLPKGVACYAIAATAATEPSGPATARGTIERALGLVGDGLVPLDSALGRHGDPKRSLDFGLAGSWIAYETRHLGLLDSAGACEQMQRWLSGPALRSARAAPR
jgi:pimeloyl-ACP methyl ester carboxylesterase